MSVTRTLSLDVAGITGYAVLRTEETHQDGEKSTSVILEKHGKLKLPKPKDFGDEIYPWNYIHASKAAAEQLVALAVEVHPDVIVIEETNLAKARYSQKLLEFFHNALLNKISESYTAGILTMPVFYLSSQVWRTALGLVMSKDDKKNNKLVKLAKEKHAIAVNLAKIAGKKPPSLQSIKKDLGVAGKVNWKKLALRFANDKYSLNLQPKDDDIADAICVGTAFAVGARPCDGVS